MMFLYEEPEEWAAALTDAKLHNDVCGNCVVESVECTLNETEHTCAVVYQASFIAPTAELVQRLVLTLGTIRLDDAWQLQAIERRVRAESRFIWELTKTLAIARFSPLQGDHHG